MSSLTVYKASAGSGKTFTLAAEYIKFLIKNPGSYRNILAVTFTNKATDEMKMRILGQLYGIAAGLPDSDAYLDKITEETGIDRETARKTAATAIVMLVHNYDYFHVETIDTFFQSVLRNLAKELDLSANLRIELNDRKVESQAVDSLIEELDRKSTLFSWLMRFIMENINDNKSWDMVKVVKDFGLKIFNDEYRKDSQALNAKLTEKGFYDRYTKRLTLMKKDMQNALEKLKDEFCKCLTDSNLELSDLKGGRTIGGYFSKLAVGKLSDKDCLTATLGKCMEDSGQWARKNDPMRDTIIALAEERLIPLIRRGEELRPQARYTINSVDATLQNLKNLMLLNDIEKKVREMNIEANRFLLSDTQHLLHMMINDSDSPFIFEKIGTRLKHIMIDEFQDTSTVQWGNFLIMLKECMSHCQGDDVSNLIVGDVKQSIYRWRSGDWQLLGNIRSFFGKNAVDIRGLGTNFRSAGNIVAFNNAFFKTAVKLEADREREIDPQLAEKITVAYSDVEQKINKTSSTGLVRVKLMPPSDDYQDRMISEIETTIDELLANGVSQNNIAILVRYKKYIPSIANYFNENRPDINIVSDEAFRLDHSVAVNTVIAALRLLYAPDDKVTRACLMKSYQNNILNNSVSDLELLADDGAEKYLPHEYTDGADALKKFPLYDLVEKIISIFHIDLATGDSAYICAFFDCLSGYISDMSADVAGFLKEWDDNLHSNKIQTDEIAGVQIISVHASKGLEFDNVIIPFCDWKLEKYEGNYIWCRPTEAPYNELPLIPVKYSPALADSVYADDYKLEHMQNTMDNLNLLYVAFTRAGKNLFIIGKRNQSTLRSYLIQNSLESLSDILPDARLEGMDDKDADIDFEFGSFLGSKKQEKEESENVFLKKSSQKDVAFTTHEVPVAFRQSNKSKDFVEENDGDDDKPADKHTSYVKIGNILHLVFSNIKTAADIDSVLEQFEADGILYGEDLDRTKIQNLLDEYLATNEMVADWFSGHWTLYNECSILSVDKDTGAVVPKRPDRVMKDGNRIVVVDFKFGKMRDAYKAQVAEYMRLIRDMGYTDVKGYLWLVRGKKIIEVKN